MSVFEYCVRPGYGSQNLLIELNRSNDEGFAEAFRSVIAKVNAVVEQKEDLWVNDEMIYRMTGDYGRFEVSNTPWGVAFIIADDNQEAIHCLDRHLQESELFGKVEVDFSEYT